MVGGEVEEALGADALGGCVDVRRGSGRGGLGRAVCLAEDEFALVEGLDEVVGGVVDEFALVEEAKGEGGCGDVGAGWGGVGGADGGGGCGGGFGGELAEFVGPVVGIGEEEVWAELGVAWVAFDAQAGVIRLVAVDAEEGAAGVVVVVGGWPGVVVVEGDPGVGLGGDVGEEGVAAWVCRGPVGGVCVDCVVESELEGAAGAGDEGADVVAVGDEGGYVAEVEVGVA